MTDTVDTSKETVERFGLGYNGGLAWNITQSTNGEYVRHDDYATLQAERDQLRREVEEARDALRVYACKQNWVNGAEWNGLHAPRIVALEALKARP